MAQAGAPSTGALGFQAAARRELVAAIDSAFGVRFLPLTVTAAVSVKACQSAALIVQVTVESPCSAGVAELVRITVPASSTTVSRTPLVSVFLSSVSVVRRETV